VGDSYFLFSNWVGLISDDRFSDGRVLVGSEAIRR